jgi:hypothetical protein
MTLIATYVEEPFAVAIGDLLLTTTTPNPNPNPPDLPARFLSSYPVTNEYISRLFQKVLNISPLLAMSWAGDADTARAIALKVSQNYDSANPLDHNLLDEAVNSFRNQDYPVSLLFLAMIPDGNGLFRYD